MWRAKAQCAEALCAVAESCEPAASRQDLSKTLVSGMTGMNSWRLGSLVRHTQFDNAKPWHHHEDGLH